MSGQKFDGTLKHFWRVTHRNGGCEGVFDLSLPAEIESLAH
jgi:hypothetical protein